MDFLIHRWVLVYVCKIARELSHSDVKLIHLITVIDQFVMVGALHLCIDRQAV